MALQGLRGCDGKAARGFWRGVVSAGLIMGLCGIGGAMEFVDDTSATGVLTLRDGAANVFSYRYGDQLPDGVDGKFIRSTYIHPLWAPDGTILTDDFPADHWHHHGVFWGWPIVKARGETSDNWMHGDPPLRHHFVRWIERKATSNSATLACENRWVLGEQEEVAREQVRLKAHAVENGSRAIDVSIRLEAVGGPLVLQGSQEGKKGYGGFSYRAAPSFKGARILTDTGVEKEDILMQRHKWLDLTDKKNGLAVFVAPDHPAFPPYGFARKSYTGFLNVSWPGLEPVTLEPGKPVMLNYRLYIHPADQSIEQIQAAYDAFAGQFSQQ